MWAWFCYHMYYEFGHLVGEFPYYTPSTDFTDEELGIPGDEEGLAPTIANVRSSRIPGCNTRPQNFPKHLLERHYDGDTGPFKF